MSAAFDELLNKYIDLKTKYDNLLAGKIANKTAEVYPSNKIFLSEPAPFDSGAPAPAEVRISSTSLDNIAAPFRASVKL